MAFLTSIYTFFSPFFVRINYYVIIETKIFCSLNILRRKASGAQPLLMATILQMGPLSSSAVTTPFVFAEGGQPFNLTGRIIASLACSPLRSPLPLHPSIKFPTLIAFPGSQSVKRRKNLEGGGKRKNSIVGSLYSSPAYALQTTNCEPQSRKKEAQRSKAVEDWPTGLQFSGPWLL